MNLLSFVLLLPCIVLGCGEGWDAYKDYYNTDPGEPPGQPWVGDETVFVVLGQTGIETSLEGIVTSAFGGVAGVRLSDLIEKSQITDTPEPYRYDFTATDGYNLLEKRGNDIEELPSWENMQNGFFYYPSPSDSLETAWVEHPWGGDYSAYKVRDMDGGEIELLTP
jgi:hypothetical protein